MKLVSLIVFIFALPSIVNAQSPGIISEAKVNEIVCGNKITIKDHMGRMGFIIRSLRESVNDIIQGREDADLEAIVMVDTQILRTHLVSVFPKTPDKIKGIKPGDLQSSKLVFQGYLLRLISKTMVLEETLIKKPANPFEEQSRRLKIANTIVEMDEIVKEAHKKFRF